MRMRHYGYVLAITFFENQLLSTKKLVDMHYLVRKILSHSIENPKELQGQDIFSETQRRRQHPLGFLGLRKSIHWTGAGNCLLLLINQSVHPSSAMNTQFIETFALGILCCKKMGLVGSRRDFLENLHACE